ncbi:MAG: TetR/AcrR family transcriptional regulator [Eubacteriales bacterium]
MNEKFFLLPPEKQQNILSAGYRVFSRNSYRKSPMSEIAGAAGISKALLFHYFRNKRELYLFLWDKAAELTIEYLTKYGCYEKAGFFEMMERGMRAKLEIMKIYPDMAAFTIKAFYEKDPEVHDDIQRSYHQSFDRKAVNTLQRLDLSEFREDIDLRQMYREMYLFSVGYLWESMQLGEIQPERVERDYMEMIGFWEKVYLKKDESKEEEKTCPSSKQQH